MNQRAKRCVIPIFSILAFAATALGQSPGQVPVWSDEFNQAVGSAPDPTKWTYDVGGNGWGNQELETYTTSTANSSIVNDPAATDGKALAITAIKSGSSYTSARIKTQGLFSMTYGLFQARLREPAGKGIWPSFWMLGSSISTVGWPQCGEIDNMENIGVNLNINYGTLHGPPSPGFSVGTTYSLPNNGSFNTTYHIFSIQWSPNQIQWMVDGTVYQTLTPASLPSGSTWVFNNAPFFMLLNMAVGGTFPGSPDSTTVFPQTYYVDYVRVYNLTPAAVPAFSGSATSSGAIGLSWTPAPATPGAAQVSGYQIARANNSGFTQNMTTFNAGATTSYMDSSVTVGTTYYYEAFTIGADGGISSPSSVFSMTAGAPSINIQPQSAAVTTGSSFSLNVAATGVANLTYQWSQNGAAIAGATGSTYSVSSAAAANAGSYTVAVSNAYGSATSSAATVTVNTAMASVPASGGGGGAPSYWFYGALVSLLAARKALRGCVVARPSTRINW